ncbi:TMEM175 family protein [Streptacidiphilus anmyonensis]|uniref:TMEM175 family protein n=1 Tax=Streptacidiphilus anmyonensis TaxID=405782 RepID=UPI0005A85B33|nr:TMEM175 family protein [Streptacidiphilus anmyonensis]
MNESSRVEAFSDGVFAIAITLLVLQLAVVNPGRVHTAGDAWHELGHLWTAYDAYVVSFLVIGIMWLNHHTVFGYVARVDRGLLVINLVLLLVVAALPFPTALVSDWLGQPGPAEVSVAVFSAFMVAHALSFQALWWWLTRTGHLFDRRVDVEAARGTRLRFAAGTVAYPILVGLSFVSPVITLGLHFVLALYYAFNQLPIPLKSDAPADDEEAVSL